MSQLTKTWWGTKFMAALQGFMDEGRLKRGRSYCTDHRLITFEIKNNTIHATMRGNINPYFGIYKEPQYKVTFTLSKIPSNTWDKIIQRLSKNAAMISRLMLFEMPNTIEQVFSEFNTHFLPKKRTDLESHCSCPDWQNPCKHVAGIYFKVAQLLDEDPFFMFQLRGISKEILYQKLIKTEIGQALVSNLELQKDIELTYNTRFYTEPIWHTLKETPIHPQHFWSGKKLSTPLAEETDVPHSVSGLVIKKQGDYPSFWKKETSFFETMQAVYDRVKMINKKSL